MLDPTNQHLRVVAADEDRDALERTATVLRDLGHEVAACAVSVAEATDAIARERPDLAVVTVHEDDDHALDLIEEIASFLGGPVVGVTGTDDPGLIEAATLRGMDAYAREARDAEIQSAIAIARHHDARARDLAGKVRDLEGAIERRAIIERAKGVLMERHGLSEGEAFERLRSHARSNNRTVVDVARAVLDGFALLGSGGGLEATAQRESTSPGLTVRKES